MNDTQQDDKPRYVQHVERHYGAAMGLLRFVATETADKGADIAARALALLAPLPNAVSVYNLSQTSLGYAPVQAFAFAASMEIALFAIIEVALHMWDGMLTNPKRYAIPLGISIVASLGVLTIVIAVVYNLEVKAGGSWVLALLPLVSMCAFVALGLKRWHERGAPSMHKASAHKHKPAQHTAQGSTVQDDAQPSAQPVQDGAQIVVIDKKQHARQMHKEGMSIAQIADTFKVHRNTASAWVNSTNGHNKGA